jgi:hypothetical protein
VIFPQGASHALRKREHPGFRGRVVCLLGSAHEGRYAGYGDYRTAGRGLLESHLAGGGLAAVEGAVEVGASGWEERVRFDHSEKRSEGECLHCVAKEVMI